MGTEFSAVLQTGTRSSALSLQNGSVIFFPLKKSTPGSWRRSAGSTLASARVPKCQGSALWSDTRSDTLPGGLRVLCLPSRAFASPRVLSAPLAPRLHDPPSPPPAPLRCLLPRLQSAHLPSLGKTRRAGIPRPERPGGHWACSVVRQVRGCEPLLRLADSSRGRASSSSRAGSGRMMAAAAAAGSGSGGGSSGGGDGSSSSSDTSSTGEEERMRRLFQTCDGDGDGYISRYWGGTRNRLGRNQPLRAALDPSSAPSPQLPASCSEAHGKSWLRL